ncbi:MAG TPA: hypothetical protein VK498_04180 [Ferruginibacter sp.]|nr:hypothetical protein [Ferruginibacter sp.]
MKPFAGKWIFRLIVTGLFIFGLLLCIIFNPVLSYANNTTHNNYTIWHNKPFDTALAERLNETTALLMKSELYISTFKYDICLNEGTYPWLLQKLRGQAFGWGFYNKVVLQGIAVYKSNFIELNGYKWNLTQLLTHEAIHCLQYNQSGFFKSNPVANIPVWKWEGYPEYIARQNNDQKDLSKNIERFIEAEKKDRDSWAINFADKTIAPKDYYKYWLLVEFCFDIKKMNYARLLKDTTSEETVSHQMLSWYQDLRR